MSVKTAGQAAYETVYGDVGLLGGMWDALEPFQRERWEAAAQAAASHYEDVASELRAEVTDLRDERDSLTGRIAELLSDVNRLTAERDEAIEVADAAGHFAETWRELITGMPDDYRCTYTCAEANAAADLYRALDDDDTAAAIITAHAAYDEEGDEHYHGPRKD